MEHLIDGGMHEVPWPSYFVAAQARRLLLAGVVYSPPMSSLGRLMFHWSLTLAVLQFEGGVVVISHDSQLLSVVCDDAERSEVWLVEDGKVERYDGYFQDYKDELVKEIADEMDEDEVYQRPDAIPSA